MPDGVEPKPPLNGEVVYTGKFDEVNEWIAENKHIQAVYTLSTPEVAKNNVKNQIQAILDKYDVEDAAALSSKIDNENNALPDLDKAKADLAEEKTISGLQPPKSGNAAPSSTSL